MKTIIYLILGILISSSAQAAESRYKDNPVKTGKELNALLSTYEAQARKTLPYFNGQLQQPGQRSFFVVTRIYQGKRYEQIFVLVDKHEPNVYAGRIASNPSGDIKFKRGDAMNVPEGDVRDWVIVNSDGTEEGNLQGKALDLYQAGQAVFTSRIRPVNGKYESAEVVSVINPKTRQEIKEIVPKDVLTAVEQEVARLYKGKEAESGKDAFVYTITKFPDWEIIKNENKLQ